MSDVADKLTPLQCMAVVRHDIDVIENEIKSPYPIEAVEIENLVEQLEASVHRLRASWLMAEEEKA